MTDIRPPIVYRHSRAAAVLYAIASETAESLLAGTGLRAVTIAGRAVVNVAWFEYAESSIGPYREFSLGIIASRERLRLTNVANLLRGRASGIGAFIVALPVDSEVARGGGVALYGLPKTLLELQSNWQPSHLEVTISEQARTILTLHLPLGAGFPLRVRQLLIFSRLQGQILSTPIDTDWVTRLDLVGRPRLTVVDRSHELGHLVTQLGLASAHRIATVHGQLRYAELPSPAPVA